MKQIFLTLGVAIVLTLTSCGSSTLEEMQSGEDLQKMRAEIAAERAAVAEVMAEEVEAVNHELLYDKWWIADEKHGGSDQFFGKDGSYDTDFGKLGTWEWIEEGKTMKIVDNGQEITYQIVELSESKLVFNYNNYEYTYYPKQAE